MSAPLSVLRSLAFGGLLLAAPARAGDWYVDAVEGSNSNGGTGPNDAWRTITWAVAHAPALQGETVHVATGVYDLALGEQFPIAVRSGQRIVGSTVVSLPTVVWGTPQTTALFLFQSSGPADVYSPSSGLENMSLTFARRGVVLKSTDGVMSPVLRDLALSNIYDTAIVVDSSSPIRASPTFERLGMGGWTRGALCKSTGTQTQLAHFVDCRFMQVPVGIAVQGAFDVSIERGFFYDNASRGLELLAKGANVLQSVTLRDTAIVEGDRNGIEISGSPSCTSNVTLERCTLAGSQAASLRIDGPQNTNVSIFDSILAASSVDIAIDPGANAQVVASNSLILDGYASGTNGCFSADPMFHSPGDYRLSFGSPCIDRGTALPTAGPVIDGDLDLVLAPDLGAFEFQPLFGYTQSYVTTELLLEVWGPAGATSVVKWSRLPLPGTSSATPFGQFHLAPQNSTYATLLTLGAIPSILTRQVPTTPELIGQTFSFQALTDNPASPSGKAYSNPLEITITYP